MLGPPEPLLLAELSWAPVLPVFSAMPGLPGFADLFAPSGPAAVIKQGFGPASLAFFPPLPSLTSVILPLALPGVMLAFDGAAEAEATMGEASRGAPLTGVAAGTADAVTAADTGAAVADADPAGEEAAPTGDGAPAPPDLALLRSTTLTAVPSFCRRC